MELPSRLSEPITIKQKNKTVKTNTPTIYPLRRKIKTILTQSITPKFKATLHGLPAPTRYAKHLRIKIKNNKDTQFSELLNISALAVFFTYQTNFPHYPDDKHNFFFLTKLTLEITEK